MRCKARGVAEAIVNFGKDQNCSMLCSQGGGRIKASACWRRGRMGRWAGWGDVAELGLWVQPARGRAPPR
jgi:hypothetical protein